MSKPIKNLITQSYRLRFESGDGAVLIDIRGVPANGLNKIRAQLAQQAIHVSVVKNSLVKKAVQGTVLENISQFLKGPTTLVHGGSSVVEVARQLLALAKDFESLQFKGAVMEGHAFGPDQIEQLSKYPTRAEAQAQALQLVLSPGMSAVGHILGPGRKIASLVKAIEEKLEKGKAISAPAAA